MFAGCDNLIGGVDTKCSSSNDSPADFAKIDGGSGSDLATEPDPGYFTRKINVNCKQVDHANIKGNAIENMNQGTFTVDNKNKTITFSKNSGNTFTVEASDGYTLTNFKWTVGGEQLEDGKYPVTADITGDGAITVDANIPVANKYHLKFNAENTAGNTGGGWLASHPTASGATDD